ncbi:DMT family transporter [Lyticum sinuosum]|uniref:S-adenosylmethionine uptake transporter n=1 Tax=Lyticum sinuosum TaxID=1332059 RepID=A0AAE4VJY8_9RICK|nr:DMT family transporter [Lyticum sinuosum]MDZ5760910.1 EamA family transporter [Lyticum sinuosum]
MNNIGEIFAIISGLLYASIGYFAVHLIKLGIDPLALTFWRFSLSALILMIFIKYIAENKLIVRKQLFNMLTKDSLLYCGSSFLYFYALEYIGSGLCMVIFFIYPVFVSIINYIFYGKKISRRYWYCLSIIIIGIFFLVDLHEIKMDITGIVLSILSSILYALYCINSTKTTSIPISATLIVCIGSALFSLLLIFSQQKSIFLPENNITEALLYISGLSLFGTVLPILLLLKSFKLISVERASLLSVSEPIFGVIIGFFFLGENLTSSNIIGIILIISAATIIIKFKE